MRQTFGGLNGVRGVAAIMVATYHADPLIGFQIAPSGYLAVDLFFVLSGCVISHAYDPALNSGMTAAQFLRIRLIRFYPIYLIGMLLGLLLFAALSATGSDSALSGRVLLIALALGLLFLPTPGTADMFPLNVPAWSLFYELVVNVLYASLHRYLNIWTLAVITATASAALIFGTITVGSAEIGPQLWHAPFAIARTVFSFSAGVLIYRIRDKLPAINPALAIVAVAALTLARPSEAVRPIFDLICILFIFPALIAALLSADQDQSAHKIYDWLGDISYPLYVIHYPAIWLANGLANRLGMSKLAVVLFLMPILILVAYMLEQYLDKPIRTRLRAGR